MALPFQHRCFGGVLEKLRGIKLIFSSLSLSPPTLGSMGPPTPGLKLFQCSKTPPDPNQPLNKLWRRPCSVLLHMLHFSLAPTLTAWRSTPCPSSGACTLAMPISCYDCGIPALYDHLWSLTFAIMRITQSCEFFHY